MNKIDELVREMCPDGVEYVKIKDVTQYEQPTKYIVKDTKYNDDYKTPVLTAGQTFILGYTDETNGIYIASKDAPVIIFDDFTGALKWVDFPFKIKSSAMKLITAKERILIRYLYYVMMSIGFNSTEHKRLWLSIYSEFKIPLPPIEIQERIVNILDKFTDLTKELNDKLKDELTLRKKQYEYYRDALLDFTNPISIIKNMLDKHGGVEYKELSEICIITSGGDIPKENYSVTKTENFTVPIISNGVGDKALYGYTDIPKITETAVTISARGTIGYAEYRDYSYYPVVRLLSIIPYDKNELNCKYLYYCLQDKKYNVPITGIPQLTIPMMKNLQIPLPPLAVQEKIVAILDKFYALCNDLNAGLPAEIEMRTKEYEYYRDKLLSFK